ncbi:MAG: thiamine ABC transporter substrate-binding protein [Mycobacteriaceae bacterium]
MSNGSDQQNCYEQKRLLKVRLTSPAKVTVALALMVIVGLSTSCSARGLHSGQAERLVFVTHDSFALSDGLLARFTEQTGVTVDVVTGGDAGELATKLALAKDAPIGDVAFGIDNTFASRVLESEVFDSYTSILARDGAQDYQLSGVDQLTAIDHGDVCINIDTKYFAEHNLPEPATFDDLINPRYQNLTVVENPATSSPGLAFLLATIAEYADNWQDYWRALKANGVTSVDSWEQAYSVDFTGSSGKGSRPIVVSYASSPPFEVGADGAQPTTKALLNTCFRQVEYAGILHGTKNKEAAQKLIDFLLSAAVQADLPNSMYVYPVQYNTPLPDLWSKYAPIPENPHTLPSSDIAQNRETWQKQWRSIFQE